MSRLCKETIFSALTSLIWLSSVLAHVLISMVIHLYPSLDVWVQRRTSPPWISRRCLRELKPGQLKSGGRIRHPSQNFDKSSILQCKRNLQPLGNHIASLYPLWLHYHNRAISLWDVLSFNALPEFLHARFVLWFLGGNARRIFCGGTAGKLLQMVNAFVNNFVLYLPPSAAAIWWCHT